MVQNSVNLAEQERRAINYLAVLFETAKRVHRDDLCEKVGIPTDQFVPLRRRLFDKGCLARTKQKDRDQSLMFSIESRVVDLAREINIPPDNVARAISWLRSHRVLSIMILALLGLSFLLNVLNQVFKLVENFGCGR